MVKVGYIISVLVWVSTARVCGQQGSGAPSYDTLPTIVYEQDLSVEDDIRCTVYLFVPHFRVFERFGNLTINVYVDPAFYWNDIHYLDEFSKVLFGVVFKTSIMSRLGFFKDRYDAVEINFYSLSGQALWSKEFRLNEWVLVPKNLNKTLSLLRIPCCWRDRHQIFQTSFFCIEERERDVYYLAFLRFLKKMDFMNKRWKEFRFTFFDCSGKAPSSHTMKRHHD
jgi:hypothetical protein